MLFNVLTATLFAILPASAEKEARQSGYSIGGIVDTTSGPVQGRPSELRPDVSAYLGIPYAEPPIEELRFAAPVRHCGSKTTINATAFSPDCPANRIPTRQAPIAGPAGSKILLALAQAGDTFAEDCLTVNVWTKPQSGSRTKAVLFWIYGGAFSTGNTASPVYDGAVLADEDDVVVVSANYRVNVFGFPGAPGVTPNAGLLDQRLALEWARDNVAAFGGDPDRITVFGQSAGGASTDYLNYAYVDDPIAHAFIPHSGNADTSVAGRPKESVQAQWFKVSQALGCGGPEHGKLTVRCVREKSMEEVLEAMAKFSGTALQTGFGPFTDGRTVPRDIGARGRAGNFAQVPYLTGSTDNEATFFLLVSLAYTNLTKEQVDSIPTSIIQPALDVLTLASFTCGAAEAAKFRVQNDVPVWRYRYYGGNYSNTYVNNIGSAYHTSELPIVFGTAESVTGVKDSAVEAQAARYMRKAWTTFAKDPVNGLSKFGWPKYDPKTTSEVRLAYRTETEASFIPSKNTDALCPAVLALEDLQTALTGFLASLSSLLGGGGGGPSGVNAKILNALLNIQAKNLSRGEALTAFVKALQRILG